MLQIYKHANLSPSYGFNGWDAAQPGRADCRGRAEVCGHQWTKARTFAKNGPSSGHAACGVFLWIYGNQVDLRLHRSYGVVTVCDQEAQSNFFQRFSLERLRREHSE